MTHLVDTMAYANSAPWHKLGTHLPPNQSIEIWAKAAGMDWEIKETPVQYAVPMKALNPEAEILLPFSGQKVLYRSDNQQPLSVVSDRYQVVQPQDVLEFYRDLTEQAGYQLETAGVLKEGKKFWALAKTGQNAVIRGNDLVEGYLLLATSCDGTLATTATPTTVRVVCNNTLTIALDKSAGAVKVPHSTLFDADAVKAQLGIAVAQWDDFMYRMKQLADCKVSHKKAQDYFKSVLSQGGESTATQRYQDKIMKSVHELYQGHGRGAEVTAAKGTAWGLLCSITEYVDHERRAHNQENRLDSAWFGQGSAIKQRALEQALSLIN